MVEGIRWPGFALLEVLSPCVTFRPEQREWKHLVRGPGKAIEGDRPAATAFVLADDGFSTGILFRDERAPLPLAQHAAASLGDIEKQFAVTA